MKEEKTRLLNENIDLQVVYEQCVQELALQQSKRDQLIAFYLTITGLVSAYLFSSDISFTIRIIIMICLFAIGYIWSMIAMRYKVYKEVYWITCKTVSSLFSVDRDKIDKACIQDTFRKVIKKCYKSVKKNKEGKPLLLKFIVKNLASAEYLMFLTLVLLSDMAGSACILSIMLELNLGWIGYIITGIFFLLYAFVQTIKYNKAALSVFDVVIYENENNSDAYFNKIFEKAWLIHFFA